MKLTQGGYKFEICFPILVPFLVFFLEMMDGIGLSGTNLKWENHTPPLIFGLIPFTSHLCQHV